MGLEPYEVCLLFIWNVSVADNACEDESENVKNTKESFLLELLVSHQLCTKFFNF